MINFDINSFWKKCLTLSNDNEQEWNEMALSLFNFQYYNNEIYQSYCNFFLKKAEDINHYIDIPFLPISFFKSHSIVTPDDISVKNLQIFKSSGTTGSDTSKHYLVKDEIYKLGSLNTFESHFGYISDAAILCLLPNYLEQGHSSLVYMCEYLIQKSKSEHSGFYLYEHQNLAGIITRLLKQNKKIFLIGVSYALIDFAMEFPLDFKGLTVIETGGMKGRREEWTKKELHEFLKAKWNLTNVASEYGMTELLSQAYSKKEGIFIPSIRMKALVREINDPLSVRKKGHGLLNIIDLANIHSCSFIATDDLGIVYDDGTFEIKGRRDHTILRGCNALVQ